jgi:hypothetical protein
VSMTTGKNKKKFRNSLGSMSSWKKLTRSIDPKSPFFFFFFLLSPSSGRVRGRSRCFRYVVKSLLSARLSSYAWSEKLGSLWKLVGLNFGAISQKIGSSYSEEKFIICTDGSCYGMFGEWKTKNRMFIISLENLGHEIFKAHGFDFFFFFLHGLNSFHNLNCAI